MESKKKNLRFEETQGKGKTKRFYVYSTHSGDYLGYIHWRSGWRCYVMSYEEVDMSVSCDDELNKFMHELEDKRKQSLKTNNEKK